MPIRIKLHGIVFFVVQVSDCSCLVWTGSLSEIFRTVNNVTCSLVIKICEDLGHIRSSDFLSIKATWWTCAWCSNMTSIHFWTRSLVVDKEISNRYVKYYILYNVHCNRLLSRMFPMVSFIVITFLLGVAKDNGYVINIIFTFHWLACVNQSSTSDCRKKRTQFSFISLLDTKVYLSDHTRAAIYIKIYFINQFCIGSCQWSTYIGGDCCRSGVRCSPCWNITINTCMVRFG